VQKENNVMKSVLTYIKDSYTELLENVSWPKWEELTQSLVLVLVGTLIFSVIIFLMDKVFSVLLDNLYQLF
ncbi:MAG: preprotein translocase subunit SecE, partial [Bacteroidia bacterium]|jgi:preprotein translocase subunit SecE